MIIQQRIEVTSSGAAIHRVDDVVRVQLVAGWLGLCKGSSKANRANLFRDCR